MAAKESSSTLWIILIIVGVVGAGVFLAGGAICAGVLIRGPMLAEQANAATCLNQIAQIDAAVEAYHLKHGEYPPDLETLFDPDDDGSPPLLIDRTLLIDPWGDPIEYDLAGNMNYGARPDIWSDRHDPIGNWQLPHPPKK
jgi:Type II secretion system (T2SS), protein G